MYRIQLTASMELTWEKTRLVVAKNEKSIILKPFTIDAIKEKQHAVMEYIAKGEEATVELYAGTRLNISSYKGELYVNLRDWFTPKDGDKMIPTKRGVILTVSEWSQLIECLLIQPRTLNQLYLAKESFKIVLRQNIDTLKRRNCNGCRIDHGSQREHSCLGSDYFGNPIDMVEEYGFLAMKNITIAQFTDVFFEKLRGAPPAMNPIQYLAYCYQERVSHELCTELTAEMAEQ